MMRFLRFVLILLVLSLTCVSFAAEDCVRYDVATVDYDSIYWAPGIQYCRVIELNHNGDNNGMLVATYELLSSGLRIEKPGYNIHVSRDGGATWEMTATVHEKAAAIQSEWEPVLYELPHEFGGMPEGTLLLSACSVDSAHAKQTALRMYRSFDLGYTWEQFGTVVTGKSPEGVYEPFLELLDNGQLACYYSTAVNQEKHSQILAMKLSTDGKEWSEEMEVVALNEWELRPGMATVARMKDGRYIMTYEMCNAYNPDCGNPVYYRFSEDGIDWGDVTDPGTKLVTDEGVVPGSSPYVAYCRGYGDNGLVLVTSCFQTPSTGKGNVVYVNDALGAPGAWKSWFIPAGNYRRKSGGYSHAIFPSSDGTTMYFVNNVPDEKSEEDFCKMIITRYNFDGKTL